MHAYMYACMYVCVYVCMYVCMYVSMYACMHVCMIYIHSYFVFMIYSVARLICILFYICSNVLLYRYFCRDRLVSIAPTKLTESYYSCTQPPAAAILNAAGIASGNAAIATPFILMGLFVVLYFVEVLGVIPKSRAQYTKDDYDDILDKFSYLLLEAKNGELGLSKRNGKECIIRQLAEEMHKFERRPHHLHHLTAAHQDDFVKTITPEAIEELSRFGIVLPSHSIGHDDHTHDLWHLFHHHPHPHQQQQQQQQQQQANQAEPVEKSDGVDGIELSNRSKNKILGLLKGRRRGKHQADKPTATPTAASTTATATDEFGVDNNNLQLD